MKHGVLIVGASIAGYHLLKELRKKGFKDPITLIDQENLLPYNLYPLSKDWMKEIDLTEPPFFKEKEFYDENNITLKLGRLVTEINPNEHYVKTDNNEKVYYDKLVIATGSKLRHLNIKGNDDNGVFYLRNYDNASKIKDWSKNVKDVLIVGAGFIGLELASSLNQLGKNVTVVEASDKPLARILGDDASKYFVQMHKKHGVKIITEKLVNEFITDSNNNLKGALTKDGTKISAQMAVIGVGVIPNTSISHRDLKVDRGIIVNEYGETSLPDVYAAGDATVWPYKGNLIHVEHWEHAYNHAKNIAHNIINEKSEVYDAIPYFWTDQYDETFEYLGHALNWDKIIQRGNIESGKFSLVYLDKDNYPLALLFANNSEKRSDVENFLSENKKVDESKYSNLNIPFNEL